MRVRRLDERNWSELALRGLRGICLKHDERCAIRTVVAVLDVNLRIVTFIFAQLVRVRVFRCPDVQQPGLGVECRPAPVCAAAGTRALERSLKAWRREQRTQPELLHLFHCERVDLRRQVVRVLQRHPLPAERRRPGRERLRWIQHLARHVCRRIYRTLLNWPHRLARHPVEHVREAVLGNLRHRVDLASIYRYCHKVRRCGQVVVPHAVVHRLEVPLPLACAGVEAHQRLGEEVRPHAALTRAYVERLHGSGRVELPLHRVGYAAPYDHQVLEYHWRRGLVELIAGHWAAMSLGQQNAPALAEAGVQRTGRGC